MEDDAELLARARKGDQASFRVLYERYSSSILSFAWLLLGSRPDAEDVMQETFLVLIRKSAAFDRSKAQLRTWLLGVTRNLVLQKRHRRQRDQVSLGVTCATADESPESLLFKQERADAVRSAVAALPDGQREAVFLFEFQGLSLRETADILEIEVNAVKVRLHRGRESLKVALAQMNPAPSQQRGGADE
jgi:RNA polymerase sigma-70 factor (ECF subfamily)